MFLIKIWIFNFDLSMLFSFLFGVAIGIAIFALIYLLLVVSSMHKKNYIVMTQVKDVNDEVILEMINETQKVFKDKKLQGEASTIGYASTLSTNLVRNIATAFFPKSKHPIYELSVDEVILLFVYVSKRVDEILDHRGLRFVRKIKISTFIGLGEVKKEIDDNPIIKTTKKYKIKETFNAFKSVINVVNPIYWVRKLVVNQIFDVIMRKLCLAIIGIIGEETYKIYSKSVFNIDVDLDSGVNDIVDDINLDINNNLSTEDLDEMTDENNSENNIAQIIDSLENMNQKEKTKKVFFKRFGGK